MWHTFRDSAVGQVIRALFHPTSLAYPEELGGFVLPSTYDDSTKISAGSTPSEMSKKECKEQSLPEHPTDDAEAERLDLHPFTSRAESCTTRPCANDETRNEIVPTRTREGVVLVTWYTEDDDENPQQWSTGKKLVVSAQICAYTFSVYIGSSLYVASEPDVMEKFDVSDVAAALGLALYVLAYGIGPMLWSPLSEIPRIGRNPIYIATYVVFVGLCVATSLVENFTGLLILRFLLGFFGSPCLATGGASLGDMYAPTKMAYAIAFWAGAATLGPALGPVVSGFAVAAKGWEWSSWELLVDLRANSTSTHLLPPGDIARYDLAEPSKKIETGHRAGRTCSHSLRSHLRVRPQAKLQRKHSSNRGRSTSWTQRCYSRLSTRLSFMVSSTRSSSLSHWSTRSCTVSTWERLGYRSLWYLCR